MRAFNTALFEGNEKVISIAGGGGKSALIARLAENCKSLGQTTIVCSRYAIYPPPETNIYISKSTDNINEMLRAELNKSKIVYLGSGLNKNMLEGFDLDDLKNNIASLDADHIFVESDRTMGRSLSGFDHFQFPGGKEFQRCIVVIGADCLNKPNDTKCLKTSDTFWKQKEVIDPVDMATWLLGHTRIKNLVKHAIPISVFINKVEDIFHKNLAISLARQLKTGGIERVVYGSLFNEEFNLIK